MSLSQDFSEKYGVARLKKDYLSLVQKNLTKNSIILDAGCGEGGIFSRSILNNKRNRKSLIGIDLGEAKNPYVDKKYIGTLDKLPFKDNSFDLILSEWVAEHIEHPQIVFNEFNRVLKKGGSLILFTPNVLNPLVFFSKLVSSQVKDFLLEKLLHKKEEELFPVFSRCNSIRKINKLAKKVGLKNEFKQTYYNPDYFIFNKFIHYFLIYCDLFLEKIKLLKFAKIYLLVSYEKE